VDWGKGSLVSIHFDSTLTSSFQGVVSLLTSITREIFLWRFVQAILFVSLYLLTARTYFGIALIDVFLLLLAAGGDSDGSQAAGKDSNRKRLPVKGKPAGAGTGVDGDRRKASLRMGTGKRGRAASLTSMRGSLKKRDRSGDRAAREEASEERRTVVLPE
jgi:hypothetical protein